MFCTIRLSKSDPTPLYIQLANELSHLIDEGSIPVKTKLPTIRSLSRLLGINRDTVVSAYKLLETEGRVIAHIGSGTYVAPSICANPKNSVAPPITCSHIHFNKDLFPIDICQTLLHQTLELDGWSSFTDPLYRERHALKQSVSNFLLSVGVQTSPANIQVTSDLYSFFINLLKLSPKIAICAESYRDLTYTSFIKSLGFKTVDIPITQDGMDLVELEKHLKTGNVSYIFTTPYLQNPTNISYSYETKKALIDLANTYNCYIIEDGTFSDFSTEHTLTPLYSLDPQRVIYLYNFSKLYLPHLNYTFITLPLKLTKKITDPLNCTLNERLLHSYLDSSLFDNLRQRLIEESYQKYQLLQQKLFQQNADLEVYSTSGTLFFWIHPTHLPPSSLCDLLVSKNIVVSPGDLFSTSTPPPYFRVSISHLSLEEVEQVIDALKDTF